MQLVVDLTNMRYECKMLYPLTPTAPKLTRHHDHIREFNWRLCSLLMPALPERIQEVIMDDMAAESDASKEASAAAIFDETWHQVSPGGSLELDGLQAFIRNPGGVNTGEQGQKISRE